MLTASSFGTTPADKPSRPATDLESLHDTITASARDTAEIIASLASLVIKLRGSSPPQDDRNVTSLPERPPAGILAELRSAIFTVNEGHEVIKSLIGDLATHL
jgi:hypothetical protein